MEEDTFEDMLEAIESFRFGSFGLPADKTEREHLQITSALRGLRIAAGLVTTDADPPDGEIVITGRRIAIEVTELIRQSDREAAARSHAQRFPKDWRNLSKDEAMKWVASHTSNVNNHEWAEAEFVERVESIVERKDAKMRKLGRAYDEVWLFIIGHEQRMLYPALAVEFLSKSSFETSYINKAWYSADNLYPRPVSQVEGDVYSMTPIPVRMGRSD